MAEKLTEQEWERMTGITERVETMRRRLKEFPWKDWDARRVEEIVEEQALLLRALAEAQAERDELRIHQASPFTLWQGACGHDDCPRCKAEAALAQAIAQEASATGLAMEYAATSERLRSGIEAGKRIMDGTHNADDLSAWALAAQPPAPSGPSPAAHNDKEA